MPHPTPAPLDHRREAEPVKTRYCPTRWPGGRPHPGDGHPDHLCDRPAHPHIAGISGRTNIKQNYRQDTGPLTVWFPPKWGINDRLAAAAILAK